MVIKHDEISKNLTTNNLAAFIMLSLGAALVQHLWLLDGSLRLTMFAITA